MNTPRRRSGVAAPLAQGQAWIGNQPFLGYWQDPARTAGRIREGWFVTTHDVRIDPAGYVWI